MSRRPIGHRAGVGARLLAAHSVITALAGLVLVLAPGVIPNAVGISLSGQSFLLCYLLAAAELGFSWLSLWGARSADETVIRGVMLACIVLHLASALLELVALARGVSSYLWLNVGARVVIIFLMKQFLPRLATIGSDSSPPDGERDDV